MIPAQTKIEVTLLTHHKKAAGVLWALVKQIALHQFQGAPIMVQASVTAKFCPMVAINTHFPKAATPGANPTDTVIRRDAKRNPATPAEGHDKDATKESNKTVKIVERQGVIKKDMGMFYLRNVNLCATDIFPRDLVQKVCADFTCKGKECNREPCSFMHPHNPRELDKATVKAIARNFATTKKGWLSDYHFRNETTLPADVKAMIGDSKGPTQQ